MRRIDSVANNDWPNSWFMCTIQCVTMVGRSLNKFSRQSLKVFATHLIRQMWACAISGSLEYWNTRWKTGRFRWSKKLSMMWQQSGTNYYSKPSGGSSLVGCTVLNGSFRTGEINLSSV
jgi:hypothetical protein